ncbi:hypothetical protein SAMN05443575_0997 [Jatrophihabitans endophyticus]|uniref:Mce-associated membrane protein n=1 Tax=Jatrophihabitans endophyticus TaxID=1206085 RepID=A0A1M5ETK9_9ACTN|nr:hypothetical protein [Jatrophihabitans endophyticus]SHF82466.1 hypothetical protein SAMN05443575_0997 [Jatrophihabitans endophyticus]
MPTTRSTADEDSETMTPPDDTRVGIAASTARLLRAHRATPDDTSDDATAAATDTPTTDTPTTDTATTDTVEPGSTATSPAVATDTATADTDTDPPVLASGADRPERGDRAPARARRLRRPSRATAACAALLATALVFAVVAAVVWWRAGHDADRTTAHARDEVAVDARLAIATVNTADYRHPDVALRNWLAVSAGALHSQFTDSRKSATTLLAQAKMVTSATVLAAAVTKLDPGRGTATVIASVNVKRTPVSGKATTTRNRFRAELRRVGDGYKLADLALVEVQPQ